MLVLFFLLILLILFLGLFYSKLKIIVKKFDFEMDSKLKQKKDYEIRAGLYLFRKN